MKEQQGREVRLRVAEKEKEKTMATEKWKSEERTRKQELGGAGSERKSFLSRRGNSQKRKIVQIEPESVAHRPQGLSQTKYKRNVGRRVGRPGVPRLEDGEIAPRPGAAVLPASAPLNLSRITRETASSLAKPSQLNPSATRRNNAAAATGNPGGGSIAGEVPAKPSKFTSLESEILSRKLFSREDDIDSKAPVLPLKFKSADHYTNVFMPLLMDEGRAVRSRINDWTYGPLRAAATRQDTSHKPTARQPRRGREGNGRYQRRKIRVAVAHKDTNSPLRMCVCVCVRARVCVCVSLFVCPSPFPFPDSGGPERCRGNICTRACQNGYCYCLRKLRRRGPCDAPLAVERA